MALCSSAIPSGVRLSNTIPRRCSEAPFLLQTSEGKSTIIGIPPRVPVHPYQLLLKSAPMAASVAVLLWSSPVDAGVLSGFSGIESVPGPELPQIEFLNKWSQENQKRYEELDSKFKKSPVLKELLEKTKQNKSKNRREVQDKYCIRGAEWGIGDCSTAGMTKEEKEEFIATLKKNSGQ